MKNKKTVFIVSGIIIFLIIIFSIFKISHYKKIKTGNNITDKTLQQI